MIALHAPSLRAAWGALALATARRVLWLWPPARRRAMAARQAQWDRLLAELREEDDAEDDHVGAWMHDHGFRVETTVGDGVTEAQEVEISALVRAVQESEQMRVLRQRVAAMVGTDALEITLTIEGLVDGLDNGLGDGVD